MKPKVYIAGKVTGEPIAECTMKFGAMQRELEAKGFEVVNPLEVVGDFNTPWEVAMQKCIAALLKCDAILLLPDWTRSKGAKCEREISLANGMDIFFRIKDLKAHYGTTNHLHN